MTMIQCISPVDGSVYAERPVATDAQVSKVVESARAAQADWAALEFNIRRFAPPRLALPHQRPLPHINLDKILQFLIA